MRASVITIGDEILIGQIVDTNAVYLAKELDLLGFDVVEILTVSDTEAEIERAMQRQMGRVDLVIMTGGLGPTKDDVTRRVFCNFFNDVLITDQTVMDHVEEILVRFYKKPVSENNKSQGLVPSKASILWNRVGTAPGVVMKKDQTYFMSLPGVPFEMKTIFEEEVVPFVQKRYTEMYNVHKTIVTYRIGESALAELLEEWEDTLPKEVKLAYLPSPNRVRLRLSARGKDKDALIRTIDTEIDRLPEVVKSYVRTYEDEDFSEIIIKVLQNRNKTISFAESCTGGRLAILFNAKPGASAYFKGGVVCYSTESKVDVLGVKEETIRKYSVVSEEVVMEMAKQAQSKFRSDYAVATTGNAGPSKGDSSVDVGTVCIGIATPFGVFAKTYSLGQPREKVVNSAVEEGLELIYNEILKK